MRAARALAAAVVLVGLTIGVPLALVTYGRLPSGNELADLPTEALTDQVVFALLTLLAWAGWAVFTLTVIVELAAEVTGRATWRLPVRTPFEATARRLVAAITMSVTLSGPVVTRVTPGATVAAAAEATDHVQARPVAFSTSSSAAPADDAGAATGHVVVAEPPAPLGHTRLVVGEMDLPIVTVVPGDTPWGLAETHLGDGFRWHEIWDLNHGRPQPDGRTWVTEDLIRPGWELRLPTDATITSTPAPAPNSTPTGSSVGQPPTPAPPSSTIPTPPPPTSPDPTTSTPEDQTTAVRPPTSDSQTTPARPHDQEDDSTDDLVPVLAGITGATVVATGLALHIRLRRRRRTAPTSRIPWGPDRVRDMDTERAVAAASDLPLVDWAGHHLAALLDQPLDRVVGGPLAVELSPVAGLELLWDQPNAAAPRPWIATDGGWAWHVAYDPDDAVPLNEQPAGIPGLVTIGQRDGRQLLVDLEALGAVTLDGDHHRAVDLARAITFELGADEALASAQVILADYPITGVHQFPRLRATTGADALAELRSTTTAIDDALDKSGSPSTFHYRTGDAWTDVTVVIVPHDSPHARALAQAARPRRGVAAIVVGEGIDTPGRITLDDTGAAILEPVGLTFDAAGLPADTAADVIALLDALEQPPATSEPTTARPLLALPAATRTSRNETAEDEASDSTPATSRDHTSDDALGHVNDVDDEETARDAPYDEPDWPQLLVKVLGRPHVPDRPNLKRRELTLVVYLASKAQPTPASSVRHAVWGGRAVQTKTIWNLATATRSALGTLDDGSPAMPPSQRAHNTLALAPGVRTDLQVLHDLHEKAQHAPSGQAIQLLIQGLDLIEGQPFDGPDYEWAHHTELLVAHAGRLIEDTVEQLVALAADAGRSDLARHAITQGLRALPGNEVLYRARMTLEHDDGDLAGVRAAYEELVSYLADIDTEPSQATINLYRQLRQRPGRHAS